MYWGEDGSQFKLLRRLVVNTVNTLNNNPLGILPTQEDSREDAALFYAKLALGQGYTKVAHQFMDYISTHSKRGDVFLHALRLSINKQQAQAYAFLKMFNTEATHGLRPRNTR